MDKKQKNFNANDNRDLEKHHRDLMNKLDEIIGMLKRNRKERVSLIKHEGK
ncbi:MAG: hypothetical protein AAB724_00140 [Patescibacteria group bacterium]